VANIKSQKKRNRTNELARLRNRKYRSELKTAIKHVKTAAEGGSKEEALKFAQAACRLLDKAVTKGIIHKNQAANRKSGVMAIVNAIPADAKPAAEAKAAAPAAEKAEDKKPAAKAEPKATAKKPAAKKEAAPKAAAKKPAAKAEPKAAAKKPAAKKTAAKDEK
jgi:small subunit ribosomal protein S20